MAEGQGEDGPGSVGDSGATPIAVVVVVMMMLMVWWWLHAEAMWNG